ncbi:MAG TPA: hypothetical protein GXX40_07645 [Firmicutes bacterium]|nr:hypothetical protein [Bacillota bacterium]
MDGAPPNTSIASQLADLSPDELLALRMIAFACRGRGVVVERCHQKLNEISGKWRRNAAKITERLVNGGLVTITRANYRHVYKVRPELLPSVIHVLFPEMLARMRATIPEFEGTPPTVISPDAYDFLAQLHIIMALLEQHGLRITSVGAIYKRMLKEILQQLGLSEGALSNVRFGFLQHFIRDEGLVREDPSTHQIGVSSRWTEYLKMPAADRLRRSVDYCFKNVIDKDPDAETALGLLFFAGGRLVRLDRLVDEVALLGPGASWQALKTRLETNLEILLYLGILERVVYKDVPCYRITQFGMDSLSAQPSGTVSLEFQNGFYIQPNFQILVPFDAEPTLIWQIASFARLKQYDRWLTFVITRDSVYLALSKGHSIDWILSFLHQHAGGSLPQNVEITVRQWGIDYGALYFMKPLLLHCNNPELANQLTRSPKLQPYFLGKLSPSDLLVSPAKLSELQDALRADGYMPTPGIFEGPIHVNSEGV